MKNGGEVGKDECILEVFEDSCFSDTINGEFAFVDRFKFLKVNLGL